MSPSFHGKITQTKDLLIESISASWGSSDPFNKNYAHQGFFQGGGTFDTNGFNLLNHTDYVLAWGDQSKPPPAINFYLQAGTFLVSAGHTVTARDSGLQIDAGVNFVNNGGQVILQLDFSQLGYIATGPGINLGNLKIDTNGSMVPNHVGSDLNVTNLSLDGSGDVEGGVCGHVTNGSADPNIYLNVSGTISAVGVGGTAYCGSGFDTMIIKLVSVGPQPQEVQGSSDPLVPGVIPNLMTSATNSANFTGNLVFQGTTNLQGPTTFAAGSRVNFFYGTLNAVTPPRFYDAGTMGGDYYNLNTPVFVNHDFTFDRCKSGFNDGDGCHGYHLGTTDVVVNRIYLKGDLHMISGGMDLSSVEMVVVDFVNDIADQSILGENLIDAVALPSIAVHKAGGKFSITQVAGAQGMNFMGSLDIVSAGSIPTFTVPKITLGNGQMSGYNIKFTSYLPLDFGTADLAAISPGTYDLGNQVLKAGSLSLSYAFNGTAASMVMISGDVDTSTSQSGNATLEFVGGSANHHYTGVSTEIAGWGGAWQKHNILIDGSDKVILNAPVYDTGNISILGSGILDQNSQLIKNVDMIGPASSTWITGGPVPLNYTGGSSAAFLGSIQ